ncbi:MAG: hypothetical protein V1837_07165 [Candidatus Woesearchaeota archaeon]
MKKAQGISMNVIIIAALALLVLVVLSVIFLTRAGIFSRETMNCRQQGGLCVSSADSCPEGHPIAYNSWKCLNSDGKVNNDEKCCITG